MIKIIISVIIGLVLYDLIKLGYKTIIFKSSKKKLQNIIGDLVYSTKWEENADKNFWED